LAERMRAGVVARQLPHADSPIADWVTLSVGIAWTVPGGTEQPESLLARADAALYQAKRKGRNTYCVAPELGPGGSDS